MDATTTAHGRLRQRHSIRAIALAFVLVLVIQLPVEAGGATVIYGGPRASGGVALTFDDGWGEETCERIARTLRREGVIGTFFINGVHLRAEPARWQRILKGFPVGNHTKSHFDLTTQSVSMIRRQIALNEAIHERVLGRPMLKVLRPPYGAFDRRVVRVAGDLGYRHVVIWNRSSSDTSSSATASSIIRRSTGAGPGAIILMHCARSVTADALLTVIRHYKRRGIKLIGLDTMLGMRADPLPDKDPWELPLRGPTTPDKGASSR